MALTVKKQDQLEKLLEQFATLPKEKTSKTDTNSDERDA